MSSVAERCNPIERFKSDWLDESNYPANPNLNPEAINWAVKNNLSFVGQNGYVKRYHPRAYIVRWHGYKEIHRDSLEIESEKFAESERLRFMADMEIETVTDEVCFTPVSLSRDFKDHTRGEKLRKTREDLRQFEEYGESCLVRKAKLEEMITAGYLSARKREWFAIIDESLERKRRPLGSFHKLHNMVLAEIDEGWDRQTGLKAQQKCFNENCDMEEGFRMWISGLNVRTDLVAMSMIFGYEGGWAIGDKMILAVDNTRSDEEAVKAMMKADRKIFRGRNGPWDQVVRLSVRAAGPWLGICPNFDTWGMIFWGDGKVLEEVSGKTYFRNLKY